MGALLVLLYVTSPFLVVFFLIVALSVRRARRGQTAGGGSGKRLLMLELTWLLLVGAVWTTINIASLSWIPEGVGGVLPPSAEEQILEIKAFMWGYELGGGELRAGAPVRIVAWSNDTIHSTGIYDPGGRLLATVMLMPGMREQIVLRLSPGNYTVRCLEYCGDGHAFMSALLRVAG